MGVYKRGNNWWIRYSYKGKIRRESSGSENKSVAKKLLAIRQAEIAQGKYKIKSPESQVLFQDYANEFLRWAKIHRKHKSFLRYQVSLNQLLPHFGKLKITNITRKDIELYKAKRRNQASGSTINRDLACLKKMFNNAISDGIMDVNPVIGVEFFKEPKRSPNYLTDEEARRLIEACDTVAIKTFVLLGLNTGMRLNELLNLKWEDVNLDDKLIVLKDTKNNKEESIPLNETVLEHLQQMNHISDNVISKSDGSPFKDIRKTWHRVVKKAGLKRYTPHVLRHTFATMLVREGADIMTVKELGRWSDLKLVERYAHVAADHRTRVISKLDKKFKNADQSDTKGDTVE